MTYFKQRHSVRDALAISVIWSSSRNISYHNTDEKVTTKEN